MHTYVRACMHVCVHIYIHVHTYIQQTVLLQYMAHTFLDGDPARAISLESIWRFGVRAHLYCFQVMLGSGQIEQLLHRSSKASTPPTHQSVTYPSHHHTPQSALTPHPHITTLAPPTSTLTTFTSESLIVFAFDVLLIRGTVALW